MLGHGLHAAIVQWHLVMMMITVIVNMKMMVMAGTKIMKGQKIAMQQNVHWPVQGRQSSTHVPTFLLVIR